VNTAVAAFEAWDPEEGVSSLRGALAIVGFLAVLALLAASLFDLLPSKQRMTLYAVGILWLLRLGILARAAMSGARLRVDAGGITRSHPGSVRSYAWADLMSVQWDPRRELLVLVRADGSEATRIDLQRYDEALATRLAQTLAAHGRDRFEPTSIDRTLDSAHGEPFEIESTIWSQKGWLRPRNLLLAAAAIIVFVAWPARGSPEHVVTAAGIAFIVLVLLLPAARLGIQPESLELGRLFRFDARSIPWTDIAGVDQRDGGPVRVFLRGGATLRSSAQLREETLARLASTIRHRQIELAFGEAPAT